MALDPDELSLLGFLRENGPLTLDELSDYSFQEPPKLKRPLHGLKGKGLVKKDSEGLYSAINFSE